MSRLTLELPEDVSAALDKASREVSKSPEDFAEDLLRRALAVREFQSLRASLLTSLGEDAPSDEDIFKQIS
jgi:hypothetical protein